MNGYLHHLLLPSLLFSAAGTIAIFSFVFKENRFYRLVEHIFIGIAAGYGVAVTWTDVLRPMWWDPMVGDGAWWWALVVPLGLMFYGVYTTKFAWQSRLIFGVYFGLAAGTVFQQIAGQYIPQIRSSFRPLIPHPGTLSTVHAINNWIFLAILVSVLVYFFFAFEQKSKAVKNTAMAGRMLLMISLGAIFGATIMTREALLIDRVRFLLFDWLQLNRFIH
jgi:hypothetical protein